MNIPSLDFGLGEDINLLRDAVKAFADAEIAPRAGEIDRANEFPADLWLKFGEMGLLKNSRTTATVTAQRPATVLFLAREYVGRIVQAVPEIRSYLEALAEDREIDNQLVMGEDDEDAARSHLRVPRRHRQMMRA